MLNEPEFFVGNDQPVQCPYCGQELIGLLIFLIQIHKHQFMNAIIMNLHLCLLFETKKLFFKNYISMIF